MKHLPLYVAALYVAALACAAPADTSTLGARAHGEPVGLVTLDSNESELVAAFNRASGDAQLVVIVSPT